MLTTGVSISKTLRNTVIAVAFLAVLNALSGHLYAATPDDYQKRLGKAGDDLQQLRTSDGGSNAQRNAVTILVSSIRTTLPRTEKIEWPGGSVDTDNSWLHTGLDTFVDE